MEDFFKILILVLVIVIVGIGYYFYTSTILPFILILISGILITLEIFFIPGFGIIGIIGFTCGAYGVWLNMRADVLLFSILPTILLCFVMFKLLSDIKVVKNAVLTNTLSKDNGFIAANNELIGLVEKLGIAVSDLNPSGKVEIDGRKFSAVSDGQFISNGSKVKVVSVDGNLITVTKVL